MTKILFSVQDFPYNYFGVLHRNKIPFGSALLVTAEYAISTENFGWKNIPANEITIIFGFGNSELMFESQVEYHTQLAGEDIRLLTVSSSNRGVFTH